LIMGKKKDKKEKKADKKYESMEQKMQQMQILGGSVPGWAYVKKANAQEDPLEALPSFKAFKKNDLNLILEAKKVKNLDLETKEWMFSLLKDNMRDIYAKSDTGWKEESKRKELFAPAAWHLIARDESSNKPVAFSHYRFDMDRDDDVLYCYDIQLEESVRRKGLGRFMLKVLELMMIKSNLLKMMVTVFKHNEGAVKLFKEVLKYEIDPRSPKDSPYEQFDIEILSRVNAKEKQSRKEIAEREAADEECRQACADKPVPAMRRGGG